MQNEYKGFPDLYGSILNDIWKTSFYEWIPGNPNDLVPGQICEAYVTYSKSKEFCLEIDNHDSFDEKNTTWKLRPLTTRQPIRIERLHEYGLERNEHPIVKVSKLRFVVLIKKIVDDWIYPKSPQKHRQFWLVLPLFSYKKRHDQEYILNEQLLKCNHRVYFPPSFEVGHRLRNESSAQFSLIQEINESDLHVVRALNTDFGMQKGIKLSNFVLKLIVFHYFKNTI